MAGRSDRDRRATGSAQKERRYPYAEVARTRTAENAAAMSAMVMRNINPQLTPPGTRNYVNVQDAVADLGLDAERRRAAVSFVEIAKDTRDLLGVTKDAQAAGLDRELVRELIRRAKALRQRDGLAKAQAAPTPVRGPTDGVRVRLLLDHGLAVVLLPKPHTGDLSDD